MSNDHVKELKDFIFAEIIEQGNLSEGHHLDALIFQSPTSLRLRNSGYHILKNLYDNEKFELESKLNGRELLTLKNDVGWPYFLPQNHSYIILFTIKASFLLKLQGGHVKKWLAQIHAKNSKENKDL